VENSRRTYRPIPYMVDIKDPAFDRPISELTKEYESPYTRTIKTHEDYGEFHIIILS